MSRPAWRQISKDRAFTTWAAGAVCGPRAALDHEAGGGR